MEVLKKSAEQILKLFSAYRSLYEQSTERNMTNVDEAIDYARVKINAVDPRTLEEMFQTVHDAYQLKDRLNAISNLFERGEEQKNTSMSQTFMLESAKVHQKALEALSSFNRTLDSVIENVLAGTSDFTNKPLDRIYELYKRYPRATKAFAKVITPRIDDPDVRIFLRQVKYDHIADAKIESGPFVQSCGLIPVTNAETLSTLLNRLYRANVKGSKISQTTLRAITKKRGLIILNRKTSDIENQYINLLKFEEPRSGPTENVINQSKTVQVLPQSVFGTSSVEVYNNSSNEFNVICCISEGMYQQLSKTLEPGPIPRSEVWRLLQGKNSSYLSSVNKKIEEEIFQHRKTYRVLADEYQDISSEEIKTRLRETIKKSTDVENFLPVLIKIYGEYEANPSAEELYTFIHAVSRSYKTFKATLEKAKKSNFDEVLEKALESVPDYQDILYKRRLVAE
jgi:hypothetical protein